MKVLILLFLFVWGALQAAETALLSPETIKKQGLVDVQSLDKTVRVELMYATTNNFLGSNVYGGLKQAFLRKEAADKLTNAQRILQQRRPGYSLLIYDCLRPRRIQYQMWELVKGTEKQQYVGNPKSGSIHNFGAAVDLTLVDETGKPLDMGTPFDYFGIKAQPKYQSYFLNPEKLKKSGLDKTTANLILADLKSSGPLVPEQVFNRALLTEVMMEAGFEPINNEWWHFNAFPKEVVRSRYSIIE